MFPLSQRKHNLPQVYKFFTKYNRYLPKGSENHTHTTYDCWVSKGPIEIPLELRDSFYDNYAESLQDFLRKKAAPLYINERTNGLKIIPLFLDLDFLVVTSANIDFETKLLEKPISVICETLLQTFDIKTFQLFVSTSGVTSLSETKKKVGYHVVSPDIPIEKTMLPLLRTYIVENLTKKLGLKWDNTWCLSNDCDWNNVVDFARAKDPSQRLIGSCNLKKCKECKKKSCENKEHFMGFYHVQSFHSLLHIYDQKGMWNLETDLKYLEDFKRQLHVFSLRQFEGNKNIKALNAKLEKASLQSSTLNEESYQGKVVKEAEKINCIMWLTKFYFSIEPGASIKYNAKRKMYTVPLKCMHCLNKMKEHGNSSSYILINQSAMLFRCFSCKDTKYMWGKCNETQISFSLPKKCQTILFSRKKKRKIDTNEKEVENVWRKHFDITIKKYSKPILLNSEMTNKKRKTLEIPNFSNLNVTTDTNSSQHNKSLLDQLLEQFDFDNTS
jgi:hypothetical protein